MFSIVASIVVSIPMLAATTESPERPPHKVLAVASSRLGVPIQGLTLGAVEGPITLHGLGIDVRLANARRADGEKAVIAFTERGEVFDYDDLLEVELMARGARFGKIDPALFERIRAGGSQEKYEVALLLEAPDTDDLRAKAQRALVRSEGLDPTERRKAARARSSLVRSRLAGLILPITTAAADRFQALGIEVHHRDPHAPMLIVRADAKALAKVHDDPAVVAMLDANLSFDLRMEKARREVRGDLAVSLMSASAYGVLVAVVEREFAASMQAARFSRPVRLQFEFWRPGSTDSAGRHSSVLVSASFSTCSR